MYRLIRHTHLAVGLASVLFILTYAVSAVQMAHKIRLTAQTTQEDITLPAGLDPRPLAEELMRQRGYGGDLGAAQPAPGGFRVNITRPGTVYTVTYTRATGQAHIRRDERSFLGVLNRLHHLGGLAHDDGRLNAWGWALLVVSLGLLALGASGVYLWFKIHTERRTGLVLLGANLIVSLALLATLRG